MTPPTNSQQSEPQSNYLQRNAAEASYTPKTGLEEKPPENGTSDFNVGDSDVPGRQSGAQFAGAPPRNQNIDKIPGGGGSRGGGVSNNSGGQIPGGGGDSGGAKLGKSGFGSPGSPGYSTDIMKGFQGGGGGTTAAAGQMKQETDEGGWTGYGNGRGPANEERAENIDLRHYLPGAKHDPGTKLGGFKASSVKSGEIYPMSVNHWNRITTRMQERCRLGLLYDCR